MNYYILLAPLIVSATELAAWKSTEVKGEQPVFFGTLTTQEGNSFNVTNVTIGHTYDTHEKVLLYEKPKSLAPSANGTIITVNPSEDLTTTTLELQKIQSLRVPEPHTIWIWTNSESKRPVKTTYEFIEVIVQWRSGSTTHYLLELGAQDSKNPIKIFCDVIDKKMTGIRQEGTLFCPGITKTELHKKGAPFPAIKELLLEEPCYKIPGNAATINSSQSHN
jgi:hypothetical protein